MAVSFDLSLSRHHSSVIAVQKLLNSGSESVLISGWEQMGDYGVVSMRASITFAAVQRSEIS